MKIVEHFYVPVKDLPEFLSDNRAVKFKDIDYDRKENTVHFTKEEEYTTSEFYMLTLRTLLNTATDLTEEEKAAAEYSIACIKTLKDMGVMI